MLNTKTYEEIKNRLVNVILTKYEDYKKALEDFQNKVEQGKVFYTFNTNNPISQQSSSKRSAMYALRTVTNDDGFMNEIVNLSERFEYIIIYRNAFNLVQEHRKSLISNINELVSLNKITKDKFSEKTDATAIFSPLSKHAINEHLDIHFKNIEMIKGHIDNYKRNQYELDLEGIAFKENGLFHINNDKLQKIEKDFFEETLKAIKYDMKQIDTIEKQKDSKNYLKYYLLFK
ncbi:hypothetical protein [Mammaliicoccus sciuri]|uniref:hypothetical protein n=1 Tax=Mammaliicoccus sciuri TaxID=1296 RepID=UPI003A8DA645